MIEFARTILDIVPLVLVIVGAIKVYEFSLWLEGF